MNKLMLGAAAVALTLAVSPAFAADDSGVKLGLGGHFKGYVNYTDEDNVNAVDLLRETEVHFGGETTLDNGLTVGAHIEATADGSSDPFFVDESYVYFAGSWGRVNLGQEDGAAYLLQVAAPSADDNIDGLRQFIAPTTFGTGYAVDYANDLAVDADKVTYLSPVFSGFQAGVSYSVENSSAGSGGNRAPANAATIDLTASPVVLADVLADSDVMEAAVRYEGMVGSVGLIAGAGYTTAGDTDTDEWNIGADLDIGAFGLGAVYTTLETGSDNSDTWVVGADYTTGPFKLGASYLNNDNEIGTDTTTDRVAAGVTYSYGPGMTFRGSVGYKDVEVGAADSDATTVSVGTQINF